MIYCLTCGRGRQLFHVDDVMYVVVFEYVRLACLEVALQPLNGLGELFGVDARVERFVRQHQADRQVLVLPAAAADRLLPAEPLRAGGRGHLRGGRLLRGGARRRRRRHHLDRLLPPVLQRAQSDGALAARRLPVQPAPAQRHVRRLAVDLYARPVPGRPTVYRGGQGHGGQQQRRPPQPAAAAAAVHGRHRATDPTDTGL